MKVMPRRFTHKNPDGKTYRAWMDHAGTFRLETQQPGGIFAFGEMIDRLGELEDMIEHMEKENARTGR